MSDSIDGMLARHPLRGIEVTQKPHGDRGTGAYSVAELALCTASGRSTEMEKAANTRLDRDRGFRRRLIATRCCRAKWRRAEATGRASEVVQGATNTLPAAVQDVGIDFRRANVLVAQQFLHGSDVVAASKQMGGKAMPQRMCLGVLRYAGLFHRGLEGPLKSALMLVMSANDT